jgi:4-hydroxy-tetrahydrodipicolinate synthase
MREIGSVLVPMVTPFKRNGEVDFDQMGEYARWLHKTRRADSLIVSGTTGEFHSLTFGERVKLYEVVWAAIGKKLPVIAGTGCASTAETVRLTREAERVGVDMAMLVSPYYSKPDQQGIYEHFRTVARSTSLPILLYNIPLFTGVNIEPSTLAKLATEPNVVAIKEESGLNPLQTTRYLMCVPPGFRVYVGDDTMVLPILAQGGAGVVSGGAQICGVDMRKLIRAIARSDLGTARKLHRKTFPLFEVFYQNERVNPIPLLKAGIKLAGFDVGEPRSPLRAATPAEIRVLRKVMKEQGYLARKS